MKLADLDYDLPPGSIARFPALQRDASRLLVLRRDGEPRIEHARFHGLVDYLGPQDLLVVNDTRVLPARLVGRKESGGRIEILLVEPDLRSSGTSGSETPPVGGIPGPARAPARSPKSEDAGEVWLCLAGFARPPAPDASLDLGPDLSGRYLGPVQGEMHRVLLRPLKGGSVREAILRSGRVPLPPYIERRDDDPDVPAGFDDAARYQTVYAEREGAIAAPTAGLHFTRDLLASLQRRGVGLATVTLHVGPATFLPMRTEEAEDHPMPSERYEVPRQTAEAVKRTRQRGGRIVAVGTTTVRALESASDGRGGALPARGRTDLFIHPGHRFRVVDALITNFHLPRSSLLLLVAAFAGREAVLAAYRVAIGEGYRFYSYGDAMLVL